MLSHLRVLVYPLALCIIAGTVGIVGCAGSAGLADGSQPVPGSSGSATVAASPGVGADTYRAGSAAGYSLYESASENRRFVDGAVQELVRRCMVGKGFKYWPMLPLPAQYRDPARPLSVADATARGYRALDVPTVAPGGAESDAYLSSLTPTDMQRYATALSGGDGDRKTVDTGAGELTFTAGGCTGAALAQIVAQPSKYAALSYTVANVTAMPQFRPDADPQLIAANASWSTCMEGRGYRYKNPKDAIEAAAALDAGPQTGQAVRVPDEPSPAAKAIAVADATCRATTGWDTANRQAVHNSLAVAVDAHQADVLAFNELAAQAAKKAKQVLGG